MRDGPRSTPQHEASTPLESTFVQKLRSNAKFLRDCFDNLSKAEAEAVARKLDEAADALEAKSAQSETARIADVTASYWQTCARCGAAILNEHPEADDVQR